MTARIHWIDCRAAGRLAIMARPRSGDWLADEICGWREAGVDVVVSLLERDEVDELELHAEERWCQDRGIDFMSFPIPDRGVPASMRDMAALAQTIANWVSSGRLVAIHCRAGIGRSSLVAACALICLGEGPVSSFGLIRDARGVSVPDTEDQREWVTGFHNFRVALSSQNLSIAPAIRPGEIDE